MGSKKNQRIWPADEDSEKPIPEDIYPVIDTDLARDNLENNIPDADLQDL
ncbi:MAG: hypothetical protein ACLSWS_05625 [Faecalispora jeddahensis]